MVGGKRFLKAVGLEPEALQKDGNAKRLERTSPTGQGYFEGRVCLGQRGPAREREETCGSGEIFRAELRTGPLSR